MAASCWLFLNDLSYVADCSHFCWVCTRKSTIRKITVTELQGGIEDIYTLRKGRQINSRKHVD